jgi:hypothetical protein
MHEVDIYSALKEVGYKYLETNYFVPNTYDKYFNLNFTQEPINPVSSEKSKILKNDRYIALIYQCVSRQHLKKPLKVYTIFKQNNILEVSGIVLSHGENPLKYLAELIKIYTSTESYVTLNKKNFKCIRLYEEKNYTLEVGLFSHDTNRILKEIGYRDLNNICYFKINYIDECNI